MSATFGDQHDSLTQILFEKPIESFTFAKSLKNALQRHLVNKRLECLGQRRLNKLSLSTQAEADLALERPKAALEIINAKLAAIR